MGLPLNALRAFEVSARHLNFTRAADELNLTPTAVSQHVRNLEQRFGKPLFRRVPRGLALTDEGLALLPVLAESFERIAASLEGFKEAGPRDVLSVGAVGTFAVGWLLPRLREFQQAQPRIDLRIFTNNNRVDLAGEGLDFALRFGDGHWHGTVALPLMRAPLAPLCAPEIAQRLRLPRDLGRAALLRSYRADEWSAWFAAAGLAAHDGGGRGPRRRRRAAAERDVHARAAQRPAREGVRDGDRCRRLLADAAALAPRDRGDAGVSRLAAARGPCGRRQRVKSLRRALAPPASVMPAMPSAPVRPSRGGAATHAAGTPRSRGSAGSSRCR